MRIVAHKCRDGRYDAVVVDDLGDRGKVAWIDMSQVVTDWMLCMCLQV